MSDLEERLVQAAAAAIANERQALESPVGHVRGITLELVLTSAGQVHEATCYIERRTAAGALMARYAGKRGAVA
jgi:hypothetical protein